MKTLITVSLLLLAVGCGCSASQQTTIVKTGPDRFSLSGNDSTRLRGDAYLSCQKEGYTDYSVIESSNAAAATSSHPARETITVRCEKEPKSFFSNVEEKAHEVWDAAKKKVQEMQEEHKEEKK